MQDIVLDIPYQFIPPIRHRWRQRILQPFTAMYLSKIWGVASTDFRGVERLTACLDAGDSVMLVPNHPRPADPALVAHLPSKIGRPLYFMASWHLFKQGRIQRWGIRAMGAFSVYREGTDRQALNTAIELLAEGKRPLAVFGEGAVTRTNDKLNELADGVAFLARAAAKKRHQKNAGRVVVVPMVIKYRFDGDLPKAVDDVLSDIERRISWQPQSDVSIVPRVQRVGDALLTLRELEYFHEPQFGETPERLQRLIARILQPLEQEWVGGRGEGSVIVRAKRIRSAILPDMVKGKVSREERARRWRHLADIYLAQQISLYPPNYVHDHPTPERILETIERFEEDLTDEARTHRPLHAIVDLGEPIPVEPRRDRTKVCDDPLLELLRERMTTKLAELERECGSPLAVDPRPLSRAHRPGERRPVGPAVPDGR